MDKLFHELDRRFLESVLLPSNQARKFEEFILEQNVPVPLEELEKNGYSSFSGNREIRYLSDSSWGLETQYKRFKLQQLGE